MDAQRFKTAWGDDSLGPLVFFPIPLPSGIQVPDDTVEFLHTAGLPSGAAPFLSFGPKYLAWTSDLSEQINEAAVVIGSDDIGNPIAVRPDGSVVGFDHENGFEPIYVNLSVTVLAECLLDYREMILEAQRLGGDDAPLQGNIPPHLVARFTEQVRRSDLPALAEGSFWHREIATIEANRP